MRSAAEGITEKYAAAVDLLPLLASARLLSMGLAPRDPAALSEVLVQEGIHNGRMGLFVMYPCSGLSMLAPIAQVPFSESIPWVRWALLFSVALTATLATLSASAKTTWLNLAAAGVVVALIFQSRLVPVVLRSGQLNPLVLLGCAGAVWAVSRSHDRSAGVLIALVALLKLYPLVLLLPLLAARRWRALAWLLPTFALGLLLSALRYPQCQANPEPILGTFIANEWFPAWGHSGALRALWRARVLLPGAAAAAAAALTWRGHLDRPTQVAAAMTMLAALGTAMSGASFYHEGLILLPALGYALSWPGARWSSWAVLTVLAGLLWASNALGPHGHMANLEWMLAGYALTGACLWRLLRSRR